MKKESKYETLRRDVAKKYHSKTTVLPYVISWDGITTNKNADVRRILGIPDKIHAYIQKAAMGEIMDIVFRTTNKRHQVSNERTHEDTIANEIARQEEDCELEEIPTPRRFLLDNLWETQRLYKETDETNKENIITWLYYQS